MSIRAYIDIVEERSSSAFPSDRTVDEEIADLGDALFEMANLPPKKTGVAGTIFISTRLHSAGPRVKYYSGRPGNGQPSFSVSVSDDPEVVANSLSLTEMRKSAPQVIQWVKINKDLLLKLWFEGTSMMDDEVTQLKDSLKPI